MDTETEKHLRWGRARHGWEVRYNPPPLPIRSFDWVAVHPNYECWMQDGEWQSNNLCLYAPNKAELMQAIKDWEADNA